MERNKYGDQEGPEPIYQNGNGTAETCHLNVFAQPFESKVSVRRPDDQFYYPNLLATDPGEGNNNGPPKKFDYGPSFNRVDRNSMQTAPNCEPYINGPPPGFSSRMPMSKEFCQMLPSHPADNRFNSGTHFRAQRPPCPQQQYFFGPPTPAQVVPFNKTVATPKGVPQSNRFESQKQPRKPETKNFRRENRSDDNTRWRARPTIPSLESGASKINGPGDFGGCNKGKVLEIMSPEEKFQTQPETFSQLPMAIHRKIRTMPGFEITDYFESTIVRFRSQTIVDTSPCHVVFTKKPTTGQCWLMGFSRKERYRAVIKFNRLLTAHLKVNMNGNTAVEIQPSKIAQEVEDQFYMFNFTLVSAVQKFLDVLNRARSQVWDQDQIDRKPLGRRVSSDDSPNYRSGRNAFTTSGTQLSISSSSPFQPKRSYRSISNNVRDNNILGTPTFRESVQGKLWPEYTCGRQFEHGPGSSTIQKNDGKFVKFSSNVTMYIKARKGYVDIGNGELTIVDHENSYDELIFVGPKKDVVLHHHLYQWHKVQLGKEENSYLCEWTAATRIRNSPTEFRFLRELKMEVDSEEILLNFERAFTEGMKKGIELANINPYN